MIYEINKIEILEEFTGLLNNSPKLNNIQVQG